MIRRIKLIHILLFSFTVTTVVLIAIILGSWRLVISESEESARNRMQNMLGDTVAAVEERITGLEDGSRIAGSFPEIRDFVAGDEQVRFRLKNSVRAELTGLIYYEPGAVSAYLRTADGAELSACPESASYQSIIPYRVNLLVARDYHPEKPFRRQIVTGCYAIGGSRFYAVLTPLYPEQSPPTDRNFLGSLVLIMDFDAMRLHEGEKLREDVLARLGTINALVETVERESPKTVAEYRTRLEAKMAEVLGSAGIDENRILAEAAIFADHIAVDEETVRLRSHMSQLETMINGNSPTGRKIDFLIQEFNREANTIGSKCQSSDIAHTVVDLKSEIEKIREQIQNIE